jgi:sugar lactone lactonase YvrE
MQSEGADRALGGAMPIATAGPAGLDMRLVDVSALVKGAPASATPSELVETYQGKTLTLDGQGFTYTPAGALDSGNVTDLRLDEAGQLVFAINGMAVSAPSWTIWATTGDMLQALSTVLSGADTVQGGGGVDTLIGYSGADIVSGGAGDDLLIGGSALASADAYALATFAGSGRPSLGDGRPATSATLASPEAVLATASGIYITDTEDNRVVLVNAAGVISTYAGSVSAENQALGDGGPAASAVVRFPHSLYATAAGLLIGDHTYTVRLVDGSGTISHAALPDRGAFILPGALLVDGAGRIYIGDISNEKVWRADPDGSVTLIAGTGIEGDTGDGGQATQAEIDRPSALHFDGQGNLLIGSTDGPLRAVNLTTGVITTRLTNVIGHFDVDAAGNYIATRANEVLKINPATGAETVIAGSATAGFSGDGGPASAALFNGPEGVSIDAAGDIFVADTGNNRVREITPDGLVKTIAGGGPSIATVATVMDSQGLAFDPSGNLYFTDFQYNHIRRVMPDGSTVVVAGTGLGSTSADGGAAISASFANPSIIRFDPLGRLFFLDLSYGSGAVRMISPGADGVITGAPDETITTVAGQNVSKSLADHGQADGGPALKAVFLGARDFLFDSKGDLIIADWLDNRIRLVTPGANGTFDGASDEIIRTIAGTGLAGQTGDGGQASAAALEAPNRMAIDSQDNLYVFAGVNTPEASIRRIDGKTGVITTLVRNVYLSDMIVDHQGRLFYANGSGEVVEVDTLTGTQTVIAGSASTGFGGDGGDALQGLFRGASYLAVDADNNLYVVDNGNFRIRELIDTHHAQTGVASEGDTISGGAGNDTISGGGSDLVLYSGHAADYQIAASSGGYFTVTDTRAGAPDGADKIIGSAVLGFADRQVTLPDPGLAAGAQAVLREDPIWGAHAANIAAISAAKASGAETQAQSATDLVKLAQATSSVATLAYEFFTGQAPLAGGMDYLVSPTGPNPNNLNSAYYQSFGLENRYINFASNLGRAGAGSAAFSAAYGSLTPDEAMAKAYQTIFGGAPSAEKVGHLLNDLVPDGLGGSYSRLQYFESYGGDGPNGVGTKAAMVGWLLAEAVKADLGTYAKSNDAFLTDVALHNAAFGVDIIGHYAQAGFVYQPG